MLIVDLNNGEVLVSVLLGRVSSCSDVGCHHHQSSLCDPAVGHCVEAQHSQLAAIGHIPRSSLSSTRYTLSRVVMVKSSKGCYNRVQAGVERSGGRWIRTSG